jgi:hypothetical protein
MRKIKKLFRLNRLYDVNYSDQILRSLVKTTFAKKKLNILSLMIVTIIVRLHVDTLLGMILSTGNFYLDFWIQIFISVGLVIKCGWIYQIVERFDRDIYSVTRYLVNNYSDDNYRKWKRYVTFTICLYLIAYFSRVEVKSQVIKVHIIQYLICYVMIEVIERRYQMYGRFNLAFSPYAPTFTYGDELQIISNQLLDRPEEGGVYDSPLPILRKISQCEPIQFNLDEEKQKEPDLVLHKSPSNQLRIMFSADKLSHGSTQPNIKDDSPVKFQNQSTHLLPPSPPPPLSPPPSLSPPPPLDITEHREISISTSIEIPIEMHIERPAELPTDLTLPIELTKKKTTLTQRFIATDDFQFKKNLLCN